MKPARKPEKPAPAPAPSLGPEISLPLAEIVAIDRSNSRRAEPTSEEIDELAASLLQHGLLQALIVRGAPNAWRVVAGGRRWRALRRLSQTRGGFAVVRARVFAGDDDEAAVVSDAENEDRKDLHPLEAADAIAASAARIGVAAVARLRGKSARWVERRVALSNLPPVAREAFFNGRISLEAARALTAAEAPRIEALFAQADADAILSDPRALRRRLAPAAATADSPAARFVGVDAYVAAGGLLLEDLFEEVKYLTDVDLLRRLEQEKLAREARAIAKAEGWGHVYLDATAPAAKVDPDYAPGDADLSDRLEAELEDGAEGDRFAEIERQLAEIETRGVLRAIGKTDRARYGLWVGLDSEGRLSVERGLIVDGNSSSQKAAPVDAAASEPPSEAADPSGAASAPPVPITRRSNPADAPVLPFEARRLAEAAASRAAAGLIGSSVPQFRSVLHIALAALAAKGRTPVGLTRMQGPGGAYSPLARELARLDFVAALRAASAANDQDVWTAFREIVAGAVDLRRADEDGIPEFLGFVAELDFEQPFAVRIAAQLDYASFFRCAGRPAALEAIRECAGPAAVGERAWMKDEALAAEAALLARAKAWTPACVRADFRPRD